MSVAIDTKYYRKISEMNRYKNHLTLCRHAVFGVNEMMKKLYLEDYIRFYTVVDSYAKKHMVVPK